MDWLSSLNLYFLQMFQLLRFLCHLRLHLGGTTETADPHNPAVRLIKYDRKTGRHLDLFQYFVQLPEANHDKSLTPLLGYTATTAYGIPDISPDSLAAAVGNFSVPTSMYFAKYMRWYNVDVIPDYPCNFSLWIQEPS